MHSLEITSVQLGWLPFIPLIGAALIYPVSLRGDKNLSGWFATGFSLVAFILSLFLFLNLGEHQVFVSHLWHWFSAGLLNIDFGFRYDSLTAVMCLIITGVGTLIHLYAIGYMEEDENKPRFFSYLNLFLFAMLTLVLGKSLVMMFVGWEGVGLCSYLLIGFWFKEMPNAEAGQKAFVVNRIGDAGFILGMFILLTTAGSLDIAELHGSVGGMPKWAIEAAALLLFIGATGKSAQLPLYIWLPDAMAGPTPVSALIHAATMVTAGVYMMTRLSFLYVGAEATQALVLLIGSLTALLAASIALVQNDIKKVLAYSTVSQLGFMFMGVGSSAFSNGMFHVVTHAFFKACLFMCAGSVIIGCHHEQDMRQFGGLRKYMPITFFTYFIATLAIAGFPFLSGFYSKDAILWTVFSSTGYASQLMIGGIALNKICWGIGIFTAFLTAFYMTRSLMLTFFGEYRGHEHPHESPWVVTVPLAILALLSLCFGFMFGHDLIHYLHEWTRPDMTVSHEELAHQPHYETLEMLSMIVAIAGIALSALMYAKLPNVVSSLAKRFSGLHRMMSNKWYVDEFYGVIVLKPIRVLANFFFSAIDRVLVDGAVNGSAFFVEANGDAVSRLHTGRLAHYLIMLSLFTLCFLIFLFDLFPGGII